MLKSICFEREILQSRAFLALRTATAVKIYFIFLGKRQMKKCGRAGDKDWVAKNNGQIVFTYVEAEEKYGISDNAFRRAIDELMEKGFLDIARSGQGTHKVTNLYFISKRWKDYGTSAYEKPEPRKRGPINSGFQKGNQLGRNCKKSNRCTPT